MEQTPDILGSGWRFPLRIDERGGVELARAEDDIAQAITIILATPRGSRLMRPEFGSRLHELLFAPLNAATFALARHYVEEALGYWEPRISLDEVAVAPDPAQPARLLIELRYSVKATHDERALVYPFYTIPEED